jgi:hypothetical protein
VRYEPRSFGGGGGGASASALEARCVPTSVVLESALCVDLRSGEDSYLGLAMCTAVAAVPALRMDVAVVLALCMEEELLVLRTDVGAVPALWMEEAVLRTDEVLEPALRIDEAVVLALRVNTAMLLALRTDTAVGSSFETEPMRVDVMERASEACE